MRKCWRQHLHDGFGVSPHHVFVYQCVFVLFVGLSHSQCVLVSLRNGKCVKTIQLHIWEIRSFLCHSAGSRYRFGLRMWDKTNTNTQHTHTCIHGHKLTSCLLIPSHISHSIYIYPKPLSFIYCECIWLVLNMKKDTIKIVAHLCVVVVVLQHHHHHQIAWVLKTCPTHIFAFWDW